MAEITETPAPVKWYWAKIPGADCSSQTPKHRHSATVHSHVPHMPYAMTECRTSVLYDVEILKKKEKSCIKFYLQVTDWVAFNVNLCEWNKSRIWVTSGSLEVITEQRARTKLRSVLSRHNHPLHSTFVRSGRSERLLFAQMFHWKI